RAAREAGRHPLGAYKRAPARALRPRHSFRLIGSVSRIGRPGLLNQPKHPAREANSKLQLRFVRVTETGCEQESRLKSNRCRAGVMPHVAARALRSANRKMFVRESVEVGGKPLTLETGHLAKHAHGSVLVTYDESVVLVTAVSTSERPGLDFFPLTCEYVEKTYAAGRIPGGFFKREGRLRENETLTARLMDRPLRPLFPKGYKLDTQIIATVM